MSKTGKIDVAALNHLLETALVKYFATKSFDIDGQTLKATDIVAVLQKEDALIASSVKARGAWLAAAKAAQAETKANDKVRQAVRQAVKAALGANSDALGEFGITVKQRVPLTSEARVAAARKAAATRKARGTLSPKAKRAIHGAVTPAETPATMTAGAATVVAPNGTASK
jgi:hypothetical protein